MTDGDAKPKAIPVLNNPAARLQLWLELGQQSADAAAKEAALMQRNNKHQRTKPFRMLEVWSAIWDLDPGDRTDRIEYTRRAVGMIDAGVEVRRLAEASRNFMAPPALEHFHEVESALNAFMDAPSQDIKIMMGKIGATGWHSLKMLDQLLTNEAPQPSLSSDQITDLLEQTQALIVSVVNAADLTQEDRLLLAEKLREVEVALTRARITGTAEVLRATDGLMGGLMRIYLRGVDVMNHPATTSARGLVTAIMALIGVGAAASEIAGGPFPELLGLPIAGVSDPKSP